MSAPLDNIHEYTVTELSGAVKRSIEENFGFVRVRGELGRVSRPSSGHVYLDLKDEKAVLSGVIWKGVASRLSVAPEQGLEVVVTGRMTTFPGQSRYQLVIDGLEPAGVGALMALLEERKKKLAAEGLFAAERKKPLPFLPEVIGVVTSPSGAVIRDILHRLRDRFPRHVIVWPTAVQGRGAETKIADAINGFNSLSGEGGVPRPDILIVARGGGSLEDLWCFNEEVVARAVAASAIPIISAVGHETDTTLIDYVADRRAPTPTAAAEMTVPVRAELLQELKNKERRMTDAVRQNLNSRASTLLSASRGLGRPEDYIGLVSQRLDAAASGLNAGAQTMVERARSKAARISGGFGRALLAAAFQAKSSAVERMFDKANAMMRQSKSRAETAFAGVTPRLNGQLITNRIIAFSDHLAGLSKQTRDVAKATIKEREQSLEGAGRLLESVSYENVLKRGFALVRDEKGEIVRRASGPKDQTSGLIQFGDGERAIVFGNRTVDTPPLKTASGEKNGCAKASQATTAI